MEVPVYLTLGLWPGEKTIAVWIKLQKYFNQLFLLSFQILRYISIHFKTILKTLANKNV